MAEVRSSNLLEPITVFQEIFQFGEFCFEFGEAGGYVGLGGLFKLRICKFYEKTLE